MSKDTNNALTSLNEAMKQANALNKQNENELSSAVQDEIAKKEEARLEKQAAAIEEAKKYQAVKSVPVAKVPEERAFDEIDARLKDIEHAPIGSREVIRAWRKIVMVLQQSAKKNILDNILLFFQVHKNDEFLQEQNALQHDDELQPATSIKLRILYETMRAISTGRASRESIEVGMISNVLKNDDITNWVAVKLNPRK